jgi:hypothetical protein
MRRGVLSHRELCSSLWALAKLNLDPGKSMCLCGCACVSELAMRRGVLSHREPCSSLWALAK